MFTIKLTKQQLEVLKQIINRTQISGADAEFIIELKKALEVKEDNK
jgi:hypothetical protein